MKFELAKAQIEHKEPTIIGFFNLQDAKLQLWERYHNFFTNFSDVNKFKELQMVTDSLYPAAAEKELENYIRTGMRADWQRLRLNDCFDSFIADAVAKFFTRASCVKHKQHDKTEPGLIKE